MEVSYRPARDSVPDYRGCTLILPSVSIGHVAQLTADLLMSALGLPLAGHMHHAALIPVAGFATFESRESPGPMQLLTNMQGE